MIHQDIRVGDWVRFYRKGQLVIGVVQYVQPRDDRPSYIQTDNGAGKESFVLEVRREVTELRLGSPSART